MEDIVKQAEELKIVLDDIRKHPEKYTPEDLEVLNRFSEELCLRTDDMLVQARPLSVIHFIAKLFKIPWRLLNEWSEIAPEVSKNLAISVAILYASATISDLILSAFLYVLVILCCWNISRIIVKTVTPSEHFEEIEFLSENSDNLPIEKQVQLGTKVALFGAYCVFLTIMYFAIVLVIVMALPPLK